MVLYSFLPDALAVGLLILMISLGRGAFQRQQIRDFVNSLARAGVRFPEDDEEASKVKRSVADMVFRQTKVASGKFHYIAAGTVSGGSLISMSFRQEIWLGGLFLFLWVLFFAWSMMLWASASIKTIPTIESRQRFLSAGYILLSVVLKAVVVAVLGV